MTRNKERAMNPQVPRLSTRGYRLALAATSAAITAINATLTAAGELSVDDFKFDGPLGSQGARIEKVGKNHFKVSLGHAPKGQDTGPTF